MFSPSLLPVFWFDHCSKCFLAVFIWHCDRGFGAPPAGNPGSAREAATSQRNTVKRIACSPPFYIYCICTGWQNVILSFAECWYRPQRWVVLTAWWCLLSWRRMTSSRVALVSRKTNLTALTSVLSPACNLFVWLKESRTTCKVWKLWCLCFLQCALRPCARLAVEPLDVTSSPQSQVQYVICITSCPSLSVKLKRTQTQVTSCPWPTVNKCKLGSQ